LQFHVAPIERMRAPRGMHIGAIATRVPSRPTGSAGRDCAPVGALRSGCEDVLTIRVILARRRGAPHTHRSPATSPMITPAELHSVPCSPRFPTARRTRLPDAWPTCIWGRRVADPRRRAALLFMLVDGSLEVRKVVQAPTGASIRTGGEYFGELPLLSARPRSPACARSSRRVSRGSPTPTSPSCSRHASTSRRSSRAP
jgi:hypothetical protein